MEAPFEPGRYRSLFLQEANMPFPNVTVVHAAPNSAVFTGNPIVNVRTHATQARTEGASFPARMFNYIRNVPPTVVCGALAGAYLIACTALLARMDDGAEHEEQLRDAFLQGANVGFGRGYDQGFYAGHAQATADSRRTATVALLESVVRAGTAGLTGTSTSLAEKLT